MRVERAPENAGPEECNAQQAGPPTARDNRAEEADDRVTQSKWKTDNYVTWEKQTKRAREQRYGGGHL
jgi:hypothetical protein